MLPSSLLTRKFHFHLFRVINVFHPLKGKLLTVKKNFSPWIFEERQKLKIGSTKICVKSIIQNCINIWKLHIKEISASRIRDFHKYLKNISALFKNFLGTIFSLFVNSNVLANYNEQEITTRLAESQQKALNFLCAKQHTPRSLITPPPLPLPVFCTSWKLPHSTKTPWQICCNDSKATKRIEWNRRGRAVTFAVGVKFAGSKAVFASLGARSIRS